MESSALHNCVPITQNVGTYFAFVNLGLGI